jgi:hypothetical protein
LGLAASEREDDEPAHDISCHLTHLDRRLGSDGAGGGFALTAMARFWCRAGKGD